MSFDPTKYGDSAASFYDQLYPTIELGLLVTLIGLAGSGPVLDLGIGTGRVAIPLWQAGVSSRYRGVLVDDHNSSLPSWRKGYTSTPG